MHTGFVRHLLIPKNLIFLIVATLHHKNQLTMSQPKPHPTSRVVNRYFDRLHNQISAFLFLIPSTYTFITQAGSGSYGDVYFCLPSTAITSTHADSVIAYKELTKQLVAIKICTGCGSGNSTPTLHDGIRVMQAIAATNCVAKSEACGSGDTARSPGS
jgi:hypothetical protein